MSKIDAVLKPALEKVLYPGFDTDIITMDLVEEARMEGSKAVIKLRQVSAPPEVREALEDAVAAQVQAVPGVGELELHLPEPPKPKKEPNGPRQIKGVKAVVPVASGKGGVGKSTLAVNLALGLQKLGLKVGILDLDLYGPSLPIMLGSEDATPGDAGDKIAPVDIMGMKALSIGFMVKADQALIWRGPLLMKAVKQMLHDVEWGELDVLVLDLPPGTGDVQITMAQEVPVTGAVVVTTPQDVALRDAIKGVDMFKTIGAKVFGIVENMSYFICPDCSSRHEIFGHGSVKPLCAKLEVDFLGEVPLDGSVRDHADKGTPVVLNDSPAAKAYMAVAEKVAAKLK